MSDAGATRPDPGPGGAAAGRSGQRDWTADDLAYLNRMTLTGQVLPNVVHELNNALQVIGGLAEMMAGRADLPGEVREKLGRMGAHAGRAVGLVRDLVAFSRRDDASVRLVDLTRLVEQVLAFRRYHLSRERIVVDVQRRGEADLAARADGHAVVQILLNLLLNAERALEGRAGGRVTITLDDHDGGVRVAVHDNGPGLDAAVRARAGEAFFTTRPGGVGLGLAVARELAAQQGGRLSLEEPVHGGLRATVWLPKGPA